MGCSGDRSAIGTVVVDAKQLDLFEALVTHPWVGFWAVDEEHAVPA